MNTQLLCIQASLKKMTDQGHFSICVIDNILELTGTIPNGEAYKQLRLLHCVHFKDMPQALVQQLPELLAKCLGGPTLRFEVVEDKMEVCLEAPKPAGVFARLLGR